MFEIKITPYNEETHPYKEKTDPYNKGLYYSMVLNHHVIFSYNLLENLFFHMQEFKGFDRRIHKDRHLTKWLARFSKENYETLHKGRNF